MRAIIKLAILFGLAILAVFFLKDNTDSVMLITGDERRTMSLLTALLFLIVAFGVLYIVVRLIVRVLELPKRFSRWSDKRHEEKDVSLLEQGWIELLEGRSDKAEKDLLRLVDHTDNFKRQILASMAAARASHDLGKFDKRDSLLADARQRAKTNPRFEAAVAIVQAELLLEQGKGFEALDHLEFATKVDTKNSHAEQLLLRAYRQTGMTLKMVDTARKLVRKNLITEDEMRALLDHYGAIYMANASFEEAQNFYNTLSRDEKAIPNIALMMASRFEQLEDFNKAGEALEISLHQKLDSRLLAQYVRCPESEVSSRINQAQRWLAVDENNPELLVTLGQLCLMAKLWGQAERYLNKSLEIQDNAKAHALLGVLNDRQGRQQEAIRHWRLASGSAAALAGADVAGVLAAADMSNDPSTPPDVKNLDKLDDRFLANNVETGRGIIENKSDDEYFDSAPPTLHK
ncbi:MAG: heme biosynthesis HemY N-terminal domain-containing protein [Pelistega sp.]|nr:heme biosynthesis HemY N-terminal domain-containing protein [Pelistega sp.]